MAAFTGCLALVLVVAVPWVAAAGYKKMGPGECHGASCRLVGQYCSEAPLHQGCRDCAHLVPWCPDDEGKLEKDFPQCAYICDCESIVTSWLQRNEITHLLLFCFFKHQMHIVIYICICVSYWSDLRGWLGVKTNYLKIYLVWYVRSVPTCVTVSRLWHRDYSETKLLPFFLFSFFKHQMHIIIYICLTDVTFAVDWELKPII